MQHLNRVELVKVISKLARRLPGDFLPLKENNNNDDDDDYL